jgi:hypothetical protein
MRRHLVDDHRCSSRTKVSDATNGRSRIDVGMDIKETLHQNINPDLSGDPELVPMEMLKGKDESQYEFVRRIAKEFCLNRFDKWCPYNLKMKTFLRRFYKENLTEAQFNE